MKLCAGADAGPLHTALPAAPLRPCISHYWLCLNNADAHHAILPDGAVDMVWTLAAADDGADHESDGVRLGSADQHSHGNAKQCNRQQNTHQQSIPPQAQPQALVFGSSRTRTLWPLRQGAHYLGIRFRPGQARHFLDVPASALTDAARLADEVLRAPLRGLCQMGECMEECVGAHGAAAVASTVAGTRAARPSREACGHAAHAGIAAIWAQLDAWLLAHLHRCPPRPTRMDALIRHIQALATAEQGWQQTLHVAPLAAMYGKSRRQFERQFVDAVGLSPKRFAETLRFQRALALLAQPHWPLAQIAAELGYADQSHFSRAFARLYGAPPARARRHAAFVQDVQHCAAQNGSLSTT